MSTGAPGPAPASDPLIEPGRIDLIATDLDGTLWDRSNVVHPRTVQAVRRLQHAGIHVLAATGRRPASVSAVLQANGLELAAVYLDGALGRDVGSGENFHSAPFAPHVAEDILERFESIRPRHATEQLVEVAGESHRDVHAVA